MLGFASDVKRLLGTIDAETKQIPETRKCVEGEEPEEVRSLKQAVSLMLEEDSNKLQAQIQKEIQIKSFKAGD
jgi:hypothetical protein